MIKFMALASLLYSFSLFYFLTIIIKNKLHQHRYHICLYPQIFNLQLHPHAPNIDNVAIIVEEARFSLRHSKKSLIDFLENQKSDLQRKWKEEKHLYLVPAREEYKGKIDDPDVENKVKKNLRGVSTFLLFARSFGAYTVNLGFGIPKQSIPLIFDTAGHLTWVPCTSK